MKIIYTLLLFLNIFFVSCSNKESDNKSGNESIKLKKSNKCIISRLIIEETSSTNTNIDTIAEPIAITFFNLNNLLAKHDGKNQDSLPEKLRDPGRQEIYRTYDISGMYYAIIEPKLDSLSIKKLDSDKPIGLISFKLNGKYYTIDKEQYKETDGVLLFNGTDKPIFWTEGINCDPVDLLNCYYNNNCPDTRNE